MRTINPQQSRESGVVSIFIVIFFMIFMSIIVIGFVKMVNDDQSQATDSDLSASARASAQSGAEDGKRLLLLCRSTTDPLIRAACVRALGSTNCYAVTDESALTDALGIDVDRMNGRKDGIVSGNSAYEQRYTCMNIKTATDSVEGISVASGSSELIPLNGVGNFTSVQFSWHATADSRNGQLNVFRNDISLPAADQWKAAGQSYAAAMRLEFIAYPKTGASPGVSLDRLDGDTRTILLVPGRNIGSNQPSYNLNTADIRFPDNPNTGSTESTPKLTKCQTNTEYACTMEINLTGPRDPANYNYFLRVSAVYGSSYIKAQLKNGAATVKFDDVQPLIDVTGRTNDVFRRIQTRVQYVMPMYLPQYALEAGELCKNMTVTNDANTSTDSCNAGSPVFPPGGGGDADLTAPGSGGGGAPRVNCWETNGWTYAGCWDLKVINKSTNAPGTVASCTWTWGDGATSLYPGSALQCQPGQQASHMYTQTAVGVFTTYPVTLTNKLTNGSTYVSPKYNFRIPG